MPEEDGIDPKDEIDAGIQYAPLDYESPGDNSKIIGMSICLLIPLSFMSFGLLLFFLYRLLC